VDPARSEGGQRLYSDTDIERLSLLRKATELGRNIGQVANLDLDTLATLVREDLATQAPEVTLAGVDTTPSPEPYLARALVAVEQLDPRALEDTLRQALLSLPASTLMEQVVAPLLTVVGARWHQGMLRPSHEHLASVAARRILGALLAEAAPPHTAPGILVTTPAGQVHELGALLVAATAALEGWHVTYLGADLPAADVAEAAMETEPRFIALSVVYPLDDPLVGRELQELRRRVDPSVEILLGGSGSESYRAVAERLGMRLVSDLGALRELLRQVRN
jgi:methanogenic corrinoid protein MtbC1